MGRNYPLHIFLFLVTLFTTLMAGAELVSGRSFFSPVERLSFSELGRGLEYAFAFLAFLTVHEFGHYLTAVYHRVRCSLPYYIPIFIPMVPLNIGSFGAVIRIREVPPSRRKYFDIGVAGPLAGFVVALGVLIWGLTHLPPLDDYILGIHPTYTETFGGVPTEDQYRALEAADRGIGFSFGGNLLFFLLLEILPIDRANMPPSFEMMHYPYIFVGYLTLFFTALNLLPIGQLDGGHVTYGLFGRRVAGVIGRIAVIALMIMGGTGVMQLAEYSPDYGGYGYFLIIEAFQMLLYLGVFFYVLRRLFAEKHSLAIAGVVLGVGALQFLFNLATGGVPSSPLWLLYALMVVTVIGVDHPAAADDTPLNPGRKAVGWLAILIFVLCFSPAPLIPLS